MDRRVARVLASEFGSRLLDFQNRLAETEVVLGEIEQDPNPSARLLEAKRGLLKMFEILPAHVDMYTKGLQALYDEHEGLKEEVQTHNEKLGDVSEIATSLLINGNTNN